MDVWRWLRNQWDRAIGFLAGVAGAIAVVIGWFGVSGAKLPSEQIPYVASGAIGGLFLLGVAATLWLSADMRDEWRKLDEVLDELRKLDGPDRAASKTGGGEGRRPGPDGSRRS